MQTRFGFGRIAVVAFTLLAVAACEGMEGGEGQVRRIGADLIAADATIDVADSIPGDVIAAGGSVTVRGVIGGDVLGGASTLTLMGAQGGSIRAAASEILIASAVSRNVMLAAGRVEVAEGATVGGNVYVGAATVVLNGTVDGGVLAGAGRVTLNGVIGGDVRVEAETLSLGPNARIAGSLTYRVPEGKVTIDPDAVISGEQRVLAPREQVRFPTGVFKVLWRIAFIIAAVIAVFLFPRTAAAAVGALQSRPAAALGFGVLWVVLTPVALFFAAITVVGLPVAVIAGGVYLSLWTCPGLVDTRLSY